MQNELEGLFFTHSFFMVGVSCASRRAASGTSARARGGGFAGETGSWLNLKRELHAKTGEDGFSANSLSLLVGNAKPKMSCRTGEKGLELS